MFYFQVFFGTILKITTKITHIHRTHSKLINANEVVYSGMMHHKNAILYSLFLVSGFIYLWYNLYKICSA